MLSHLLFIAALSSATAKAPEPVVRAIEDITNLPSTIAFGSCARQIKRQPILDTIVATDPELFIYLGDNIYADTRIKFVMQLKYKWFASKPKFKRLRAAIPTVSTWDDHDYGRNDDGVDNRFKQESERQFLDFWRVPADSERRHHPGIYGHHIFEANGRRLSIILLDTRYFRDTPSPTTRKEIRRAGAIFRRKYKPNPDPSKTILGQAQWAWLKDKLEMPADLRIIVSSVQFGHSYNGLESWNNFPAEKERMLALIKDTHANGVIFLSGDVHWGEISRVKEGAGYPIYDVTSSGLTQIHDWASSNKTRVGKAVKQLHFGMMNIDWAQDDPLIALSLVDINGEALVTKEFTLSSISSD
jgi:alkaline phosphatase D